MAAQLELSKVKKTRKNNSPPLFNPFSIPIKEITSIPTTKLGNNDKKEIELFQKIFHAFEKLENPTLPKQTLCIHKSSLTNPPKNYDSNPVCSDRSNLT